jgi:hypothetical protein
MLHFLINAKVLHYSFSPRHTTPLSSLVGFRGRMGSVRLLETSRWWRLHSLARRSATPTRGSVCSRLAQAGPWETPAPTSPICGTWPVVPVGYRILESARPSGVSSPVIEPPPTPVSNENFPQLAGKHKLFRQKLLGVYWGSFAFMFRRIFACGRTWVRVRLFGSFEDTTPWGARWYAPSIF